MELGGIRIYHAGDCDLFPEMKDKSEVALLLIGGTCTMDEEEATNAAAIISPKVVIPIRYGRSERRSDDPEKFNAFVCSKNPNIYMVILDS